MRAVPPPNCTPRDPRTLLPSLSPLQSLFLSRTAPCIPSRRPQSYVRSILPLFLYLQPPLKESECLTYAQGSPALCYAYDAPVFMAGAVGSDLIVGLAVDIALARRRGHPRLGRGKSNPVYNTRVGAPHRVHVSSARRAQQGESTENLRRRRATAKEDSNALGRCASSRVTSQHQGSALAQLPSTKWHQFRRAAELADWLTHFAVPKDSSLLTLSPPPLLSCFPRAYPNIYP